MRYPVSELDPRCHFEVTGVSFIGAPRDGTVLFVTVKMKRQLSLLQGRRNCLVFAETGLSIPEEILKENCILFSDAPVLAYGRFIRTEAEKERLVQEKRPRILTPEGYWKGENVRIGEGAVIEPGCLIDHDVDIGQNARIGFGSVIRCARIGDDFRCGAHVRVGEDAFFPVRDGDQLFRIPSFGRVEIGNNVDLGSQVIIERGFNSQTVLGSSVMLDAGVCVGHDDEIGERVTAACGVRLAGLVTVGPDAYLGMNASVKQRLSIGKGAVVGMGSVVISHVAENASVFGIPARKMGL